MRRTLAVLVTAGAFLVPAGAASAADTHTNASCSNGQGGNYATDDGRSYNDLGNQERAASSTPGCGTLAESPVEPDPKGRDKKRDGTIVDGGVVVSPNPGSGGNY